MGCARKGGVVTGRKTSKSGGGDVVIERVMSSDTFLSREIRKAPMRKTDSSLVADISHIPNDLKITIQGAREHNLKNVDLAVPRNRMVVFIGIETFLSFLRLVDAGNNMSGFGYKFLFGSTPWLMLTAILAVWVIGLNVVQHGPQWFKMAAFVAMVAAAGLRVLAWLIYLFSGNSGYYGYGYSDGAATAIAWIGFFALLGLLAQVIVLLVGWLQQRV